MKDSVDGMVKEPEMGGPPDDQGDIAIIRCMTEHLRFRGGGRGRRMKEERRGTD